MFSWPFPQYSPRRERYKTRSDRGRQNATKRMGGNDIKGNDDIIMPMNDTTTVLPIPNYSFREKHGKLKNRVGKTPACAFHSFLIKVISRNINFQCCFQQIDKNIMYAHVSTPSK